MDTPRSMRASRVLAELARRGVDTNREALADMSDRLGMATRPIRPGGATGNRRWSGNDVELLVAAFQLRTSHGVRVDTITDLVHGRTDPQTLVDDLGALLRRLVP